MLHATCTYSFRYSPLAIRLAAAGSCGHAGDAVLRFTPPTNLIIRRLYHRLKTAPASLKDKGLSRSATRSHLLITAKGLINGATCAPALPPQTETSFLVCVRMGNTPNPCRGEIIPPLKDSQWGYCCVGIWSQEPRVRTTGTTENAEVRIFRGSEVQNAELGRLGERRNICRLYTWGTYT